MSYTTQYDPLFQQVGQQYGFDPLLLKTIAIKESSINPNVSDNYNNNGTIDVGMMQINSADNQYKKYGYSALKSDPATAVKAAAETLQEKVGILQNKGMPVNNFNLLWAYNGLTNQGYGYATDAYSKYTALSNGVDISPSNSGGGSSGGGGGFALPTGSQLLAEPSRIFWLILGAAVLILGLYVATNPLANLSNVIEAVGEKK